MGTESLGECRLYDVPFFLVFLFPPQFFFSNPLIFEEEMEQTGKASSGRRSQSREKIERKKESGQKSEVR